MRLMFFLIMVLSACGANALAQMPKNSSNHGVYDANLAEAVLKKMKLQYSWRINAYTQTTRYDSGSNSTVVAMFIAGFDVTNGGTHAVDSVKLTCNFFAEPGDTQSIDSETMTRSGLIKAGETKNFPEAQMGSVLTERAFAGLEHGAKPKCRIESIHLAE